MLGYHPSVIMWVKNWRPSLPGTASGEVPSAAGNLLDRNLALQIVPKELLPEAREIERGLFVVRTYGSWDRHRLCWKDLRTNICLSFMCTCNF